MAVHQNPSPFPTKTYDLVDDPSTDGLISWSSTGNSFVVWDCHQFSRSLLPKFFKHTNFASFVRQLNTYGFRKIDPDRWEFANKSFLRGQRRLLQHIRRRNPKPNANLAARLAAKIKLLKKEKNGLMSEAVRLSHRHQTTVERLQAMRQRLRAVEQEMVVFAEEIQNFWSQLLEQKTEMLPTEGNGEDNTACQIQSLCETLNCDPHEQEDAVLHLGDDEANTLEGTLFGNCEIKAELVDFGEDDPDIPDCCF